MSRSSGPSYPSRRPLELYWWSAHSFHAPKPPEGSHGVAWYAVRSVLAYWATHSGWSLATALQSSSVHTLRLM